jgi:hypothetical protein
MGRTACTEPQCLYKGNLYLYLYFFQPTVSAVVCEILSVSKDKLTLPKNDGTKDAHLAT